MDANKGVGVRCDLTFGVAERESIAVLIDCEEHVALVHELIIQDLEHF